MSGGHGYREELLLRLHRHALRLYPGTFRQTYRDDLTAFARERSAEARHRGPVGRVRLAVLLGRDLLTSLPREWVSRFTGSSASGTDPGVGPGHDGSNGPADTVLQDTRFALRTFLRRPGFAAAVIVTLGVGIGATTAMVGIVDRVVLRPLPYGTPDRLVQIGGGVPDGATLTSISPAEFHRWRERASSLDAVAASRLQSITYDAGEGPIIVGGAGVSAELFDILDVAAWRGRLFTPAEDRPEAAPVAVLTWGAWERHFGADPEAVGRTLEIGGLTATIIGILPPSFAPPEAIYHHLAEVYFPLSHVRDDVTPSVSNRHFLQAVGRLAPGATLEQARTELRAVQSALFADLAAPPRDRTARAELLHARTVGDFGRVMVPFLAAVGFLLLVACANVAHLFLVRASERVREVRIRRSLGAVRGRIVRQLVTESVLVCGVAALLGAVLAWGGVELFRALAPSSIPRAGEVAVDLRVLSVSAGLGLLTGLVFGLVPALPLLRAPSTPGLPGIRGRSTGNGRVRGFLLVGEVAVALTLFIGASLLASSFLKLVGTDLGFEPDGAAYLMTFPTGERYESPDGRITYVAEATQAALTVPGVHAVGWTDNPPLYGNMSTQNFTLEGYDGHGDDGPTLSWHQVAGDFFAAVGAELVAGRAFARADDDPAAPVVVVNEALARAFWGVEQPAEALGRRIRVGDRAADQPWMEVVGVVADIRHHNPGEAAVPELYMSWWASSSGIPAMIAGVDGDPEVLAPAVRRAVQAVDPTAPIRGAGPYREVVAGTLLTPRFRTSLLGIFAGVALLLALVGVYATMAYSVRQQRHELGVRLALGAATGQIRAMVLRQGLALMGLGIAAGLGLSLLGTRVLEGMVYGVTPTDPAIFAAASVLLTLAGAAACWIPARRATRLDPLETLKAD